MRRAKWIILCIAMLVSLAGCSNSEITLKDESEDITITFAWWGTDTRHDYTMEAIRDFEELYPNIKVKMVYGEWTGYSDKVDIQMAAKTEPDVMQINFAWLNKYSADGSGFYDLSTLSDLDLSTYSAGDLNYGRSNGILNALPIAYNSKVFMLNKSLFSDNGLAVPQSWEDYFQAAPALNAKGCYPLELDNAGAFFTTVAYTEQKTGKSIYSEENKLQFGLPEVKEMLEFYMSMVDSGVIVSFGNRKGSGFAEGMYGASVQWITNAEKCEKNLQEIGDELVIAPVPVLPGSSTTGWYTKPASMYAISAHTDYPQEAALLLDFLVNSKEMAELQEMEKGIPVSTAAKQVLTDAGRMTGIQVEAQKLMDTIETNIISPYFETSSFQSAFKSAIDSIVYEDASVEDVAPAVLQALVKGSK